MLSNFELSDLCDKLHIPLAGIYSKDNIPPKLQEKIAYIINIEDSEDEYGNGLVGSHWVAAIVLPNNDKRYCFYFDSFGIGAPKNLEKIVKSQKDIDRVVSSTKQIQDQEASNFCGWFSLAWLHFMLKPADDKFFNRDLFERYNDFLSLFDSDNMPRNDEILKRFFTASAR